MQTLNRGNWNSFPSKQSYPTCGFTLIELVVVLSLISLVPAFESIFTDFGMQLPALTRGIIAVGNAMTVLWPLVVLVILGLGVIAIVCLACESGWVRWLPCLDWLLKRSHAAVVLRNLALATERDLPITPLLR